MRIRLEMHHLTDRIAGRPQQSSDGFGDHRHGGVRIELGGCETPSPQHVDAENGEVARRDQPVRGGRFDATGVDQRGAGTLEGIRPRCRHRRDRRFGFQRVDHRGAGLLVDDLDEDGVGRAETGINSQ